MQILVELSPLLLNTRAAASAQVGSARCNDVVVVFDCASVVVVRVLLAVVKGGGRCVCIRNVIVTHADACRALFATTEHKGGCFCPGW